MIRVAVSINALFGLKIRIMTFLNEKIINFAG